MSFGWFSKTQCTSPPLSVCHGVLELFSDLNVCTECHCVTGVHVFSKEWVSGFYFHFLEKLWCCFSLLAGPEPFLAMAREGCFSIALLALVASQSFGYWLFSLVQSTNLLAPCAVLGSTLLASFSPNACLQIRPMIRFRVGPPTRGSEGLFLPEGLQVPHCWETVPETRPIEPEMGKESPTHQAKTEAPISGRP